MEIRVAARTDVGRVREGNEDAFLIRHPLYAIADGMGGHLGGEVASSLAVETVADLGASGLSLADRVLEAIGKAKPASFKGQYIKTVVISSSMSPGVKLASTEYSKF